MQKLAPVEEAKALLAVAANDWGVWKWLTEKKKVRQAADLAWEALDEIEKKIRAGWSEDLKKAYHEVVAETNLESNPKTKRTYDKAKQEASGIDPKVKSTAKRLKQADDDAYALRMQAEETFDEAERRLSTSMAKEGSRQAIEAWETREKLIRKFENAARQA